MRPTLAAWIVLPCAAMALRAAGVEQVARRAFRTGTVTIDGGLRLAGAASSRACAPLCHLHAGAAPVFVSALS